MPNTWQIIQRINKAPLVIGSASAAIPAYVAPSVSVFRIYGVYGEEPTAIDGAESVLHGGAVLFYIEICNPDNLEITQIAIDTQTTWTRAYLLNPGADAWWNQLTQFGRGYLWQLLVGDSALAASPVTPKISLNYLDPEGNTQTTAAVQCSNGPLTVSAAALTLSPSGWLWIGDTVTVGATPAPLIDSVDVTDWGYGE
jgi:hypothetical protein